MLKLALVAVTTVAHAAPSPSERAKALLEAQAKAIDHADGDAFRATFAADAILLAPIPRGVAETDLATVRRTSPHESLNSAKVTKLVAGGDANAVWISAEIMLDGGGTEPGYGFSRFAKPLRVTELVTADHGWKVVVAAFTEATTPDTAQGEPEMPGAAKTPSAFADVLADPKKLDAALGKDASVTVFGTDKGEAAYGGPAAHALVRRWKQLAFARAGGVREGRGAGWTYATSFVDWTARGATVRMIGLALATVDASGVQTVVAVQFAGAAY